jgi:hypothetical protein
LTANDDALARAVDREVARDGGQGASQIDLTADAEVDGVGAVARDAGYPRPVNYTLCSMTRAAFAAVLLTAALATVASGCGGSKTYSQKQVKSAFKSHGFRLTEAGGVLVPAPNSGVLFFTVEVRGSDKELRKFFPPARRGGRYRVTVPGQTFALALRKRNVVVLSKCCLDPDQRKRITLAIKSLH